MLSNNMELELNKQVNAELYSGYLYLSMASYFEDDDLPCFCKLDESTSSRRIGTRNENL